MHPEFANDPKHVEAIKAEFAEYQQQKGLWPRGHWHEQAVQQRRPVSDFCPPLREMAAFLAPPPVVDLDPPAKPKKG